MQRSASRNIPGTGLRMREWLGEVGAPPPSQTCRQAVPPDTYSGPALLCSTSWGVVKAGLRSTSFWVLEATFV